MPEHASWVAAAAAASSGLVFGGYALVRPGYIPALFNAAMVHGAF
jgi:hypothetical protein